MARASDADARLESTVGCLAAEHRGVARRALEEVCSGRDLAGIDDVFSPRFVDHVNALEYLGTDGARQSVALYLQLFPDLRFQVDAGHRG